MVTNSRFVVPYNFDFVSSCCCKCAKLGINNILFILVSSLAIAYCLGLHNTCRGIKLWG